MPRIYLKKGREAPIRRGHPWIFSGAVERVEGEGTEAGVAEIFDVAGNWLARGLFNERSQIRVRVLTWTDEPIDGSFFVRRLSRALAAREMYIEEPTDCYRWVNGEGDFLPGLIVDRYGDFLLCQFLTAGMDRFKGPIIESLTQLVRVEGIYERSEGRVRQEEGLRNTTGVLTGASPPQPILVTENGFKFAVDVTGGQKTGFFLDQRDNRAFLGRLARGKTILDCFSYSGAFSVYGFGGEARSIVTLDSSRPALELAERNLALNGFSRAPGELLKGDAFAYLKEEQSTFDIVILDPPSLAHKRADVSAATGGYKFLNLHALRRLNPGGMLLTFSCSQHLSTDLFQKVVFGAAVDAGKKVALVKRLGYPLDHPVSLHHPEGEYLKGLALRVLD